MSGQAMALSHFSDADTIEPYSTTQEGARWAKPKGLWVSVDGEHGWPEWADAEEWGIGSNKFTVTLAADASILHLDTPEAILEFDQEYGMHDKYAVDWPRLAEKYQGIIISPYQWSLRLDFDIAWYYPWDCASGCIWDATAIESVTR